jgi:hypothetical protein
MRRQLSVLCINAETHASVWTAESNTSAKTPTMLSRLRKPWMHGGNASERGCYAEP